MASSKQSQLHDASGGRRAFAHKISKVGASDVRKSVAATYSLSKKSTGSRTSIGSNSSDSVDPVDFEACMLQLRNSITDFPSAIKLLCEFPADDFSLRAIPRSSQLIDNPLSGLSSLNLDPFVEDCIAAYGSDFNVIQRKYEPYTGGCMYESQMAERAAFVESLNRLNYQVDAIDESLQSHRASGVSFGSDTASDPGSTPRGSWASNADLQQSSPDPILPGVTVRVEVEKQDLINEAARRKDRHANLFKLYALPPESEVIEQRSNPSLPQQHCGARLFVTLHSLKFDVEYEPIFASAAIFDLKTRRKISENFNFDFNTETIKGMLRTHVPFQDISTLSRSGIFSVTYPNPDLYLVIRLEKVLMPGEISDAVEPYVKEDRGNREKLCQSALEYCERLGNQRMPFAWAALYLTNVFRGANTLDSVSSGMEEESSDVDGQGTLDRRSLASNNSMRKADTGNPAASIYRKTSSIRASRMSRDFDLDLETFRPMTVTISNFFKQDADRLTDEDMLKLLLELKKGGLAKKSKCIPGSLKLEISPCPSVVEHSLSPELLRYRPYPNADARPVREILEFPSKEVYAPNATYRNLLYVYPKSLNFAGRPGSARNICIHVQLMAGEDKNQALPVVFGKSSCPELSSEALSIVTYHSKTPCFYDEIKMKLPADLNEQHHLLFTFYHISCKGKSEKESEKSGAAETPIGYSWLPLTKNGRLETGDFNLPVSLESLPKSYSYLSPSVNLPQMKWLDGHKSVFQVSLTAASTVHTEDPYLDKFFKTYYACYKPNALATLRLNSEAALETELKQCVTDLMKAKPEPLVANLFSILDKLLKLISNPPVQHNFTVNVAPTCFEMIAQIVKILTFLLDRFCDQHGRSSLLTAYIIYAARLPAPASDKPAGSFKSGHSKTITASMAHSISDTSMVYSTHGTVSSDLYDVIKNLEQVGNTDYKLNSEKKIAKARPIHEELVLQWLMAPTAVKEMATLNAWFFLELITKSMAEYLSLSGRLYLPRHIRFSDQFLDDVASLLSYLCSEAVTRSSKDLRLARNINASCAFFLRDAFGFLNRTFIFKQIKFYCRQLSGKIGNLIDSNLAVLEQLKLEFLRAICSHEHYATLNLPFLPSGFSVPIVNCEAENNRAPSPSPSNGSAASIGFLSATEGASSLGGAELSNEFRATHYLTGLVLSELSFVLNSGNRSLQYSAINIVRQLINNHDQDRRLQDPVVKTKIAALYFPLLGIVLDACDQLFDPYGSGKSSETTEEEMIDHAADQPSENVIPTSVAMAIAIGSVHNPNAEGFPLTGVASRKAPLSFESTRNLLACFAWTVKNLDREKLNGWISELPELRLQQLLDILQISVSCFEYKGIGILKAKKSQRTGIPAEANLTQQIPGAAARPSQVRWRKNKIEVSTALAPNAAEGLNLAEIEAENNPVLESHLSNEISLIVIDVLELMQKVLSNSAMLHSLLNLILRVMLHMLGSNQSTIVLQNLFASLRIFVLKYPWLLFDDEPEKCGQLIVESLRLASSTLLPIRSQAAASLYLLMRNSFENGSNFSRTKMQVTMSLSELVGSNRFISEECLRKSLKAMLSYSDEDIGNAEAAFVEQQKDLVFTLHMVLSDTVKMQDFKNDFEMLMDLQYRIAKGYQQNPDLRLTWLQTMAAKNLEKENYAEAAQCFIHSAAIVAEYLAMIEDCRHRPGGCIDLTKLSENVLEESAIGDDVVSPQEEGICLSPHFSDFGLLNLLEKAGEMLQKAQQFEAMTPLFVDLVLPIYRHQKDYAKQSAVHQKLADALGQVDSQKFGKRAFGTYFRVAFFGNKFGDLDGLEFIYKEPGLTKLAEISHRLQEFYNCRFGPILEVIKDSNSVDRNKLDPAKAYLQITYVEPFFDLWEKRRRLGIFEQSYSVKRFIYSTPFTLDGRAHGDLNDQYKRKTVLTTANSFPYLKTRIQVVHREVIVLQPIEVAIEDMQKKTAELATATSQRPLDAKMLQMVLQGSIGTTVNSGPIEIANVFLADPVERGQAFNKLQNKLRLCFKDFSKRCADALRENKKLVGPDQREYQKELERNYIRFTEKLAPMVSYAVAGSLRIDSADCLRTDSAGSIVEE